MEWEQSKESEDEKSKLSSNPYASVDPAPPALERDTSVLRKNLLDESISLFERYRAMFALRNKGDKESILALSEGWKILFYLLIIYFPSICLNIIDWSSLNKTT